MERLPLGANTATRKFDLVTSHRLAEFKLTLLARWV